MHEKQRSKLRKKEYLFFFIKKKVSYSSSATPECLLFEIFFLIKSARRDIASSSGGKKGGGMKVLFWGSHCFFVACLLEGRKDRSGFEGKKYERYFFLFVYKFSLYLLQRHFLQPDKSAFGLTRVMNIKCDEKWWFFEQPFSWNMLSVLKQCWVNLLILSVDCFSNRMNRKNLFG